MIERDLELYEFKNFNLVQGVRVRASAFLSTSVYIRQWISGVVAD